LILPLREGGRRRRRRREGKKKKERKKNGGRYGRGEIPFATDITTNAIGAIGAVPAARGRVAKSRGMTRGYAKARCTPD